MASVDNKIAEIFIPGPAGRLEAKYYKSKKNTSPIALVLHPHPQYGGTMNNKVVVDIFQTFVDNHFSVCRVNFRGVGKSDGEFDIISDANHFFSKTDEKLIKSLNKYIKKETALY